MSGGMIPNCCAQNSLANDLKKAADSPAGAAAKVKADEAEAKERAAAVRYLANVDCERWPEATASLINALRKDRNECVRLEAALALRNGCCCNNETIDALKNCVLGEQKTDPAPVERSERVRAVAAEALARCTAVVPVEDPREKMQKTEVVPNPDPAEYYKKIASMPRDQVIAGARAALVSMQKPVKAQPASQGSGGAAAPAGVAAAPSSAPGVPRPNSLSGIVANAFSPGGAESRQPFFSGLTKTLSGKQEYATPARQEPVTAPTPARQEPVTVPTSPTVPTSRPRETILVIPPEIAPPPPPPAPRAVPYPRLPPEAKPPEIKLILPPISAAPPVSEPIPIGPRESKGPMQVITFQPAAAVEATADRPRESKAPTQVITFRPTSELRLGAPVEAKAPRSIEIIQPAVPSDIPASGRRESRGTLTIEDVPVSPRR